MRFVPAHPRRRQTRRCSCRDRSHAMTPTSLNRRAFLKASGTAAGGLLVAYWVGRREFAKSAESFHPNGYVRADPDETVTVWAKNPAMGQGAKTSLGMTIADELDADWRKVTVLMADLDMKAYGGQGSGGSSTTPDEWDL